MLQKIKIIFFLGFSRMQGAIPMEESVTLRDLQPQIQLTDFVEEPIYLNQMLPKGYNIIYIGANISFYIGLWCALDNSNIKMDNNMHILFITALVGHVLVSLLPITMIYFQFRTIFAIVNNGIAMFLLLLAINEQIPVLHSGAFYISTILTHLIMNIILFMHNRKTIMINIRDLVEELQQEDENLISLI